MRWVWVIGLTGCAFASPSVPGAKQSCIDWVNASVRHTDECGFFDSPEAAEQTRAKMLEICDDVLWTDGMSKCWDALKTECGTSNEAWRHCDAFVHF